MAITVLILLLLKDFTGNVYALFVINLFLHSKNTVEPYGNVPIFEREFSCPNDTNVIPF